MSAFYPSARFVRFALAQLQAMAPEWSRANAIMLDHAVDAAARGVIQVGESRFTVYSHQSPYRREIVDRAVSSCTCAEWRYHMEDFGKPKKCVHRVAVYLSQKAVELETADREARRQLERVLIAHGTDDESAECERLEQLENYPHAPYFDAMREALQSA